MPSFSDLSGKVALVTGASSGLGRHFASLLAQHGVKVGIAARRVDALEETARHIAAAGGVAAVSALDVTQSDSVKNALSTIEAKLGPVDIVVNNSGMSVSKPVLEQTESDWDAVVDVNLKGAFL